MSGVCGRADGGLAVCGDVSLVGLVVVVVVAVALCAPAFARAGFGIVPGSYAVSFTNADGSTDTQAGSHPFQMTTSFQFNQTTNFQGEAIADGALKDIGDAQPVGLVGDPLATPRCPQSVFHRLNGFAFGGDCPNDTVVGFLTLNVITFGQISIPVFNLVPPPGMPGQFGTWLLNVPITIGFSVRTGGDYGLTANLHNISESAGVTSSTLTLWGVPADPSHDALRGSAYEHEGDEGRGGCLEIFGGSAGRCPSDAPRVPLLTLPGACGGALPTVLSADSWENPGVFVQESTTVGALGGCDRLDFSPGVSVTPDSTVAGAPAGLGVDVRVPQSEDPAGLGEANVRKTVVVLPAGMTINPSAAGGLGACTPEEIGLSSAGPSSCPDSSKVGTAEVLTPLLEGPLVGSVYVAQQANNPFGSLLALYLVVEGSGVRIKLAGRVSTDPVTGRVTTTFDNLPQQPFSDLKLSLFGGPRATLVNPSGCGSYTTGAQLTPYSSPAATEVSSAFQVTSGSNGTGCGPRGFSPSFSAGTVNNQAGAFSPFNATFTRSDGDQDLGGVTVTTPPGLLGILKGVERCPEPQAAQGTCGPNSLIGRTTVAVGAGPDPFWVQGGQVFLTGPYKGAPFGMSFVVPAVAGPFDLGIVVVRAAIRVDPHTAQVTVVSDSLPTILQGIPLDIRTVNISIDRPGFIFNPTSCEPLSVGGSLTSTQGATAQVSSRFQAANCAGLPFHPVFSVSTQAKTSKQNGASLTVETIYPTGAQANIKSVAVVLPKQLPARLTTIQQACPEAVFAANPASCPAGSMIGTATATTPVFANALTGPAYLVSHGGAAFPDVVVVFQGEGITLDLVGSVNIKHGITSSKFATVPDAPISGFQLSLPEGPHSGLAAVIPAKAKGNMCGQNLHMPFTITAQNGAQIKQNVKIAVTGCPKVKKTHGPKKRKRAKK
jgi:hypothetical protein